MALTEAQRAQVATLLGREPRGLEEIPVVDDRGQPRVIRVASLVEGKPFPTLFWLVDAALNYRIDQDEARGLIKDFQSQVNAEPDLQAAMRADHEAHIRLRDSYLADIDRAALQAAGFAEVLQERGIGGIADGTRIRCLHTWYAAHLVVPNTIGGLLDRHWAATTVAVPE